MSLFFRQCTIEDVDMLRGLSIQTFCETFGTMNQAEDMDAYLHSAFGINKLSAELSDVNSAFYFLYFDEKLAGYLKLNEFSAQTDLQDAQSLEIERIYVLKTYQGKGFGSFLMERAVCIAKQRNKKFIWLGVWEKNEKALDFYNKKGFYKIGTHSFFIGNDEQTDDIMRKDLKIR